MSVLSHHRPTLSPIYISTSSSLQRGPSYPAHVAQFTSWSMGSPIYPAHGMQFTSESMDGVLSLNQYRVISTDYT